MKPFNESFLSYGPFGNKAWEFKAQDFGIFPKETSQFVSK
jgi:hypothetical protein